MLFCGHAGDYRTFLYCPGNCRPAQGSPCFAQSGSSRAVSTCTWDFICMRLWGSQQIRRQPPLKRQFIFQVPRRGGSHACRATWGRTRVGQEAQEVRRNYGEEMFLWFPREQTRQDVQTEASLLIKVPGPPAHGHWSRTGLRLKQGPSELPLGWIYRPERKTSSLLASCQDRRL